MYFLMDEALGKTLNSNFLFKEIKMLEWNIFEISYGNKIHESSQSTLLKFHKFFSILELSQFNKYINNSA